MEDIYPQPHKQTTWPNNAKVCEKLWGFKTHVL